MTEASSIAGRFCQTVEVFNKEIMTGWEMTIGVIGASLSVGCVLTSGFILLDERATADDELYSLRIFAAALMSVFHLPIAFLVPGEAWVLVLTSTLAPGFLLFVRRIFESEPNTRTV